MTNRRNFQKLKSKLISNFENGRRGARKLSEIEKSKGHSSQISTFQNTQISIISESKKFDSTRDLSKDEKEPKNDSHSVLAEGFQTSETSNLSNKTAKKSSRKAFFVKARTLNVNTNEIATILEEPVSIHFDSKKDLSERRDPDKTMSVIQSRDASSSSKHTLKKSRKISDPEGKNFPSKFLGDDPQSGDDDSDFIVKNMLKLYPAKSEMPIRLPQKIVGRRVKSNEAERSERNVLISPCRVLKRFKTNEGIEVSTQTQPKTPADNEFSTTQQDAPCLSSPFSRVTKADPPLDKIHANSSSPDKMPSIQLLLEGKKEELGNINKINSLFPVEISDMRTFDSVKDVSNSTHPTIQIQQRVKTRLEREKVFQTQPANHLSRIKATKPKQDYSKEATHSAEIHKQLLAIKSEIEENRTLIKLFEIIKDLGKTLTFEHSYSKSKF